MSATDTDPAALARAPVNSRLIWLGTALSLAAAALLFFEPFQDRDAPQPVYSPGNQPDLELEQAVITQFRDSGELKYRLDSPLIEHYQADSLTFLTTPELALHSEPDPPWHVQAQRGTIRNRESASGASEEEVFLDGDVRMIQHFADGRHYELRSPEMYVYPDREYAETDQDVMITTHSGRTTAVGLTGDLNRGLVHLFSDAEHRVHTIVLRDQFK